MPENWHGVTDDYKLLLADVLVCVWDGRRPGGGCAGGTVRLIREALHRSIPVVWVHADERQAGQVSINKPLDWDAFDLQLKIEPDELANFFQCPDDLGKL